LQSVVGIGCRPDDLRDAFQGLVIHEGLLEELGPAVCSGRSIFLHGPPGNGKSVIARGLGRFLNACGGDIYVPYAVHVEGAIITVYDPAVHRLADDDRDPGPDRERRPLIAESPPGAPQYDLRWRKVRRPVVITGGELTLEMLDLRHNRTGHYYLAPPHVKANGGLFLVDDFGRQIVRPKELLNRWILPLEDRFDHLTLTSGRKVAVPFEQLIVFSTNLEPKSLVDDAFLRRIRHKILIGPPTREVFVEIFRRCCDRDGVPFDSSAVEYLFSRHYDRQRLPKACDPRDLLEIARAVCRFKGERAHLAAPVLAEAARRLFCEV
jgi:predicted ATPase with chaperone activity